MNWVQDFLDINPSIGAVALICFICAVGLALGKLRFRGISLGITYVFLIGIFIGALKLHIDPQMLVYAESFGLILFVYTLGLQVGPGFISTFLKGGTTLNLLSLGVIVLGTLMTLGVVWMGWGNLGDMMGVLCGSTTNTPALGAAQQALKQVGEPASGAALSCAVTYPLGLIGVIVALMLMRIFLRRKEPRTDKNTADEQAFIASFCVKNPGIFHKNIQDACKLDPSKFVVSRLWRDGKVILPNGESVLEEGDRILVITQKRDLNRLTVLFGELDETTDWNSNNVDWNALDSNLISQRILITRSNINGKHLGDLHLRNRYGVNVSRVQRSGIQLVATPSLTLRFGDRVTVVGEAESIKRVADELGNAVQHLDDPNMVTIFIGIVLGLVLGSLPIFIPGMSYPVSLGLAGGPIVMGILIGAFGPRFHMVAYTTTSANLMLRSLGLSMYLACLGLDAGKDFLETVMQPAALWWIFFSILITMIPVMIMAWIGVVFTKKSFAATAGMLCGAMANPIALNYVNDTLPGDKAAVAYATVYPLAMFLRVIIAQIIVMCWFA